MLAGTSAAMAGVAASQAAIATSAAHQARVAQCKVTIQNFDAQRSTISEMKEYAGCVDTLYPTEIGADVTIALKVLFVVALSGAAAGVWSERRYGFIDAVVGGLGGFIMAPLALASIAGLVVGVQWLFS